MSSEFRGPAHERLYVWLTAPTDPEFKQRVRTFARRRGQSVSQVIRDALTKYMRTPGPRRPGTVRDYSLLTDPAEPRRTLRGRR